MAVVRTDGDSKLFLTGVESGHLRLLSHPYLLGLNCSVTVAREAARDSPETVGTKAFQ